MTRDRVLNPGRLATVEADAGGKAPPDWVAAHRDELDALLLLHGSVTVTGLELLSVPELAAVRRALGRPGAVSHEPFAARRDFGDGVYSWPEWSAERDMCLHHEQSYTVDSPSVLLMGLNAPPTGGGTILLGDTRAVLEHLPTRLSGRLREEGWLFLRNFLPRLGLPWSAVLGAEDPEEVSRICAARDIDHDWSDSGALRLRQRRPAVVRHPVTGDECFFNDVAFMSQWSIARAERDVLLSAFGPEGVPFNTCFGSGEPLTENDHKDLMDAYERVTVRLRWGRGDLLPVDNMLAAHGRDAYTGAWRVRTALAGQPGPAQDAYD